MGVFHLAHQFVAADAVIADKYYRINLNLLPGLHDKVNQHTPVLLVKHCVFLDIRGH